MLCVLLARTPSWTSEFPLKPVVKTLCANAETSNGLAVELKLALLIKTTNSVQRGGSIDESERSNYWFS